MVIGIPADTSIWGTIVNWTILLIMFMYVLPKLYLYQIFSKLEMAAQKFEAISKKGQGLIVKKTAPFGRAKKDIRERVTRFVDFFIVPPVNLDPFGIIKKLDHVIDNSDTRFRRAADYIAPDADSEQKMNVFMGMQAAVMINMVAKIVRHYVEMTKKFKNLQFAMLLQMQLPMLEKMIESELKGLEAFLNGHAIGDGIGPMVIASQLDTEGKEIAKEAIATTKTVNGRRITFVKATGPGGRLGKIGEAVEKIAAKGKIARIITIDAAQKLEGEKTGTISEGVGIAMGGAGVQRYKIEEVATKYRLPMDAIAIKMSPFEAISPMPEKVVDSLNDAVDMLNERIAEVPKGQHIIVVGVGNTCGIPNTKKNLEKLVKILKERARKIEKAEKEKNKTWWGGTRKETEVWNFNRADILNLGKTAGFIKQ